MIALLAGRGHPQANERATAHWWEQRGPDTREWQAHSYIGTCPRVERAYVVLQYMGQRADAPVLPIPANTW